MNHWQMALLVGAALTWVVSINTNRASFWIGLGAMSFIITTMYARIQLPYPPFFNMVCDAIFCLMIYILARRRWEIWLYRIFAVSAFTSVLYLGDLLYSRYWYVATLEAYNWAALVVIALASSLKKEGATNEDSTPDSWLIDRWAVTRWIAPTLWAHRKDDPWH